MSAWRYDTDSRTLLRDGQPYAIVKAMDGNAMNETDAYLFCSTLEIGDRTVQYMVENSDVKDSQAVAKKPVGDWRDVVGMV